MLLWIVQIIQIGPLMPDVIFYPIGYLIVLFSSLIYNELIIFNFCGLSDNTKKFVKQRETKEIQLINNSVWSANNLQDNFDDECSNDN